MNSTIKAKKINKNLAIRKEWIHCLLFPKLFKYQGKLNPITMKEHLLEIIFWKKHKESRGKKSLSKIKEWIIERRCVLTEENVGKDWLVPSLIPKISWGDHLWIGNQCASYIKWENAIWVLLVGITMEIWILKRRIISTKKKYAKISNKVSA